MINSAKINNKRSQLYNSVHEQYKNADQLPDGLILLDSIKTLENDFQKRNLITIEGRSQMHPLWFLAETERNIFLWRAGHSLEDINQFEFWVDINALITKRLKQIENFNPDNPFFNSLWGFSSSNPETSVNEMEYLKAFKEILNSIISHANALSVVTSILTREIHFEDEKKIIILPGNIRKQLHKK